MDITVNQPQECDNCGTTFTRDFQATGFWHRDCPKCLKKKNERAAPRDCRYCAGQKTVLPTYQMESEWGSPYICHTCMKDQRSGYVWPHIPTNIVCLDMPMDEQALKVTRVALGLNARCQDSPEKSN